MKKYLFLKSTPVPLYRGSLVVVLTNSTNDLKKYIPPWKDEIIYASAWLYTFKKKQGYFIILNFDNKYRKIKNGTITHEALHAAHFILNDRGIKASHKHDEALAYLVEWITDQVYKFVKKNKFEVR